MCVRCFIVYKVFHRGSLIQTSQQPCTIGIVMLAHFMAEDHKGCTTCSRSQSSGSLEPRDPLPFTKECEHAIYYTPTSHLGKKWVNPHFTRVDGWSENSVSRGCPALIHHSWRIGTASQGQREVISRPPLLADLWLTVAWRYPDPLVAPHTADQPASLSLTSRGGTGPSCESHTLNSTGFSLWICGPY